MINLNTYIGRLVEAAIAEATTKVKKHMSHVYEDKSMKFSELDDIFKKASSGKLENVTEKFDGQNMMFTFNVKENQLRFARNKSHVLSGGMGLSDVEQKWSDKPTVKDAFSKAYTSLDSHVKKIDRKMLSAIFGPNGNNWFSMEVIYSNNPNVLRYSGNHLVFHKVAVSRNDKTGSITDMSGPRFEKAFGVLNQMLNVINKTKKSSEAWDASGPVAVQLKNLVDGTAYGNASGALKSEIGKYGLSLGNSIGDYVAKKFSEMLQQLFPDMSESDADSLGVVFSSDESNSKKKEEASKIDPSVAAVYFKADVMDKLYSKLIRPIEDIVHNFAVDILSGVHSALIMSPEKEISRLKDAVKKQIDLINTSSDEHAMEVLKKSMEKLKSIDNITSAMEGITFTHNGKMYKLTGNFAPVNQLLGLFRF